VPPGKPLALAWDCGKRAARLPVFDAITGRRRGLIGFYCAARRSTLAASSQTDPSDFSRRHLPSPIMQTAGHLTADAGLGYLRDFAVRSSKFEQFVVVILWLRFKKNQDGHEREERSS
jgi:hypothetical protein